MELKKCTRGDWSRLPTDLIPDILIRCGLNGSHKNLIQLKCVSKSWCSIISRECVPRLMSQPSSLPLSGLLYMWAMLPKKMPYFSYASWVEGKENEGYLENDDDNGFLASCSDLLPDEEKDPHNIMHCCNGLLLILHTKSSPIQHYVCNPRTRQCITVPVSHNHQEVVYSALAFDPSHYPPHYTIVRFNQLPRSSVSTSNRVVVQLDVFSSLTGKWDDHNVHVPFPLAEGAVINLGWVRLSTYLNGMLYMLCCPNYLICFNLKSKTIKAESFQLPERGILDENVNGLEHIDAFTFGTIGISKGVLHYSIQYQSKLLIWSFEKDSGMWNLLHSYSIEKFCFPSCKRDYLDGYDLGATLASSVRRPVFMPYAFHPTSDVIFLGDRNMIFSYDPLKNQLEVAFKYQPLKIIFGFKCYFFPYSSCPVVFNEFQQRHFQLITSYL